MPPDSSLREQKAQLREAAFARRDAISGEDRAAFAAVVADRPFPFAVAPGAVVSGFFPMKSEINPLPLMRRLADVGAELALPVVAGRGKPLTMRAFRFGDELAAGVWGIREPTAAASEVDPDILLVPLAVFDRAGHRIGYGAGYYDMTIARLRALKPIVAVGLAFAIQEVDRVPVSERDQRLDLVLTEREVIDLRGT